MEEEQARLAAEARRQRILDSANSRMDRVSGLAGSEGNEAVEGPGQKKASKLAAMRRRRFQTKKAEAASAESAAVESEATKEMTPPVVEAKKVAKEEVTAPEPAASKTEENKPAAETTTTTTTMESSSGTGDDAPKKKYMGVAKMRRKMIKERQQKQEAEEEDATAGAIPSKFSKISPPKPTFPIIMHLLTVLFLFLAGFEVGLQQRVIEYREDVTIHQTVAPQQELRILNQGVSLSYFSPTPTIVKGDVAAEEPPTPYVSKEDEDEFTSSKEKDTFPNEENIDPLFGIDLDELTAGPGLFMMMGRFAVSVHRLLLSIVYYFPIRIWNGILALIASPPVLCLTALAIRQGSHVLGGKLPEAVADDSKMSSQPQDVMATIKNVVTSFILKAFPTATKLYEAWTHLRSDMYVVMCGLFVGLVWHHYLPMLQGEATNDEL